LRQLDTLVAARRTVKRGDALFHSGEPFRSVYAVRTGFFKTRVSSEDGRDQVTGFQMAGELLGLDGISTDRHACDAIALEDSQVCVIPYGQLEELSREFSDLQHQFHKIMSREIVRDHGVMLLLGSMRAEERLAAFLLNLTQRLHARGFSASALMLRMTPQSLEELLYRRDPKAYSIFIMNIARELSRRLRVADGILAQFVSAATGQHLHD